MLKKISRMYLLVFLIAVTPFTVIADIYEDYIALYSPIAIEEMEEYGIPASITLAQGLLESGAGRSTLATQGNNHFGIKCHNDWEGEWMLRDDDKPNECFRVYDTARESFRDHSLFLHRPRYQSLYELEKTDYQAWAKGLKRCGYATSPTYANKLISIIERYGLYIYDTPLDNGLDETVAFIHQNLSSTHHIRKSKGLHYVVAFPGDTYANIAKEFGLKEKDLKEYNDAKKDKYIKEWEEVYLQPKHDEAPDDIDTVTIGEGETMRSVSQSYGVKLSTLKRLNKRAKDRAGTTLKLH